MVSAKEIDSDTKKFLQSNGPNILKILEEAKAKGYAEILDEAESRIADLREEFVAEEKDAGKDFANKVALLEDNYIALEFEMWKIEEGKSSESKGEQRIESLLIARIKLQNGLDEEVIKQLEKEGEDSVEEAEEIREEIEWRNENIEEAARDFYEEFFGELEEEEEEEEEGEEGKQEENIKLRFYKLLDNDQKNTYKKIIDERKSIYFRGYGIGLILSFIFIFIYKYILRPSKKSLSIWFLVCLTGAITFTTNYLFYILAPKSTYMINHLKNKKQITAWQNIYRTMQVKYHTGLVLGILAIMIFAYANRC